MLSESVSVPNSAASENFQPENFHGLLAAFSTLVCFTGIPLETQLGEAPGMTIFLSVQQLWKGKRNYPEKPVSGLDRNESVSGLGTNITTFCYGNKERC